MKTLLAAIVVLLGAVPADAAAIIPKPVRLESRDGTFAVAACSGITVQGEADSLLPIGRQLAESLARSTGRTVPVEAIGGRAVPQRAILLTTAGAKKDLGDEGYELTVAPESIVIRAPKPAGVFYGVQTLRQLLPPEQGATAATARREHEIPCLHVEDYPRFPWRGMNLDVARHFFPKEFIKRYIDYLAANKINIFHFYLTDDQGWRIEIKRYPRLTQIGAWRAGTLKHLMSGEGDQKRYGGFYTQDDIREIVRYARDRFVTVVPGISMPGHSQAALACYPELSSTGGPFEVWTEWGISKEVMDPGKEEVFQFVEGVLGEVIELFSGTYVHTGGDEVPRDRWKASPFAQARMKKEGLKNEDELQSYFTKRVERFLNSKGRQLIGWDEILEGGLSPNAVVMSWRGTAGGITAARAKHHVIMVPHAETYFNYMQDASKKGPGHHGYLPLLKVYHFDPLRGLTPEEAKYVLGGQGCLWSEYVPTPADAEYLLFPRLFAMAEVLWSPQADRNDQDFLKRLPARLERLVQEGVNPYRGGER
jgi:hexosaminidase